MNVDSNKIHNNLCDTNKVEIWGKCIALHTAVYREDIPEKSLDAFFTFSHEEEGRGGGGEEKDNGEGELEKRSELNSKWVEGRK